MRDCVIVRYYLYFRVLKHYTKIDKMGIGTLKKCGFETIGTIKWFVDKLVANFSKMI